MHISARIGVVLIAVLLAACGSEASSTKPKGHALAPIPPAGEGGPAGARAVGSRAGDGIRLRGRSFGHGGAAVVLAHMGKLPDNESDWYPLARRLVRDGYMAAQTGKIHPTALISLAGVNHISTYNMKQADIERIGGAKLFVSARRDPDGAADSARDLSGWARAPKRLVLLDSDLHGTDMLDHRQHTAKPLTELMVRFLRASMPPA